MESEQAGKPMTQDRIARVRELVLSYGWNSTSYQIINPGIDHWFSAKGDAVVGYVKCHNAYIVAGAPVCAKDRLPEVAAEFENVAGRERARVCYFGAEARLESLYDETNDHSMLLLGVQPAWQPSNWSAMLSKNSSLRAQINRARNKGGVVSEWPTGRAHDNPELHRCLDEWLSTRGLPPLHFLVEPATLKRLADRRIFVAERKGEVVGFLIASPVPCRSGWLIEQNIRGRNAPNGCAELLIDAAVRAMAEDDSRYVTLGLSPLSKRADTHSHKNPLWLRLLLSWIRAHGRRFYNFEGLDAFKAKFRPEQWEPVFAIANESHFSPFTLYAIATAFTQGSPILTVGRGMMKAIRTEIGWLAERVESNGVVAHKN
jgi:phosphatidylglycerol lysyltransferase